MKKLILLLFVLCIPIAVADDLTISINQSEYYFQVGQEAVIDINLAADKNIDGTLINTINQEIRQQGFFYSSQNTESKPISINKGKDTIHLSYGKSDKVMDLKIDLKINYDEMSAILDQFTIHFVKDQQQQNQQNQQSSTEKQQNQQSQQSSTGKQQSQQQNSQQQQQAQKQSSQSQSQQRLQNNQMAQDTQALKQQIQKEYQEKQKEQNSFQEALQKNQELQDLNQEMMQKGYELKSGTADSNTNTSGNFDFQYENQQGENESIKGSYANNSLYDVTNSYKMKQELAKNQNYQDLKQQLQEKGFAPKEFDARSSQEFTQNFDDEHGNRVELEGQGNLSSTDDFEIKGIYADDYLLDELSKDRKFISINDSLASKGYTSDYTIKSKNNDRYIEFEKQGKTKKIYFKEPQLIKKNIFQEIIFKIHLGFDFLMNRK